MERKKKDNKELGGICRVMEATGILPEDSSQNSRLQLEEKVLFSMKSMQLEEKIKYR